MLIQNNIDWTPLIQGVAEAFRLKQQKLDNQRQQKQDEQNAALTQAELQRYGQQNTQFQQEQQQLQKSRAFEQGLRYPKNWATMKPEDQVAYLQKRETAAQQAGDLDAAASARGDWQKIEQSVIDQRKQDQETIRSVLLNNLTTQRDLGLSAATTARDLQLSGLTTDRVLTALGIRGAQQFGLEGMREGARATQQQQAMANKASTGVSSYVNGEIKIMNAENVKTADTNPNMSAFAVGLKQKLDDVRKDPGKAQSIIQWIQTSAPFSEHQRTSAVRAIQMQADASQMQSMSKLGGGSNAAANPPPSPYP